MSTWHGEPFEDEADGKEHSKSQNEQQVIGSNQNNRPVGLSAQAQDVNKTWILLRMWISHKLSAGEDSHRCLLWGVGSIIYLTEVQKSDREGERTELETINSQTRRHCFDHAVVQSSWSTNTFRSTTKNSLIGPDSHLLLTTFFVGNWQDADIVSNALRALDTKIAVKYADHVYFSPLSVDCRPTHRPTVGWPSADSLPTVDRQSVDSRAMGQPTVGRHFVTDSRPTVGGEDDRRSTVGRLLADCRPTVW